MPTGDRLRELIERLEKAMRPLGETANSADHDRVCELYQHMAQDAASEPLEKARMTVLHEILEAYVPYVQSANVFDPAPLTYNAKAAIGAIVVFLCQLDEGEYESAASTLCVAADMLHESIEVLRAFNGESALA